MQVDERFVRENEGKRFTITFANGLVLKNIKLFLSTSGGIGYLSGRQKKRGYGFPVYDEIANIVEVTKKQKVYDNVVNAKTILKKLHSNVWEDIRNEMEDVVNNNIVNNDFEYHFTGKLNFKNVTKYLTLSEAKRLKEAFENKTEFRWSRYTDHQLGRDLKISTEIGKDGKFRAFFSSEYMGCGNGDYWLLLNPTTAIFYETD